MPPREREVDALFQVPLSEFTAARNALSAKLKKAGQTVEAREVKALAKPSLSAWAVNQLYWQRPADFERVARIGARIKRSQSGRANGRGESLRDLLNERRQLLGQLVTAAEELVRAANHPASPALLHRIASTLDAVSSRGERTGAPQLGRLVEDVQPLGFDAFDPPSGGRRTARPAAAPPAPTRADAAKRARAEAAAREAAARLQAAETRLRELDQRLDRAKTERSAAASRLKEADERVEEALREMERARQALRKAKKDRG